MKRKLLLVTVLLTALVIETLRICAQAGAKESKAAWKVIQSSLTDEVMVARFVLEPVASRRLADRGSEDSREDRRMAVWLSQASPLLWFAPDRSELGPINNTPAFGPTLDLSSTNELKTLIPMLTAYEQVIQTAGRRKGREAEYRLQRFEFTGELPEKVNSVSETREADAALDAVFLRLQEAGQAYVGAIGKPVRFDHDEGPNAPAIMFDRGNNQRWARLPEPGALLFTLHNLAELRKSHESLITQQQTRKAEEERLLLARRHSEKTEQERKDQQLEVEARRKSESPADSSVALPDPQTSDAKQQVERSNKAKIRPDELKNRGPWNMEGLMPREAAANQRRNTQNELKSGEPIQTGHKQSEDDSSVTITISRIWLAIVAIVSLIAGWVYLRLRRVPTLMASSPSKKSSKCRRRGDESPFSSVDQSLLTSAPTVAEVFERAARQTEAQKTAEVETNKQGALGCLVIIIFLVIIGSFFGGSDNPTGDVSAYEHGSVIGFAAGEKVKSKGVRIRYISDSDADGFRIFATKDKFDSQRNDWIRGFKEGYELGNSK